MTDVLIIGGGAAGLAAAITAAREGTSVTLLEKLDRVGKKILSTGNGRCNIMNAGEPRYHGGVCFAQQVLRLCPPATLTDFFSSLGLVLREEDEGRVYPVTGQSASVLDVLRAGCETARVNTVAGEKAVKIKREKDGFAVLTESGNHYSARKVIVTGGGMAAPKLGSDGSCYPLLTSFGHKLVSPRPALTQVRTDTVPIKGLQGQRVQATVTVSRDGKELGRETGEVLFTAYGVSGVCVMQLSRLCGPRTVVSLNLVPEGCDLRAELEKRVEIFENLPMEQLFCGLFARLVGMAVLKMAKVPFAGRVCGELNTRELAALCRSAESFTLPVQGVNGFDQAQVTAGGIDTIDFDPESCASRLCPGLYACGEVLDVDGDCGGFNLMFAFACGILAGRNAARC